MENLIIDDSALQSKKTITDKDIYNILPETIKEEAGEIRVLIDKGQPQWVIFLKADISNGYCYHPHSGKLVWKKYAKECHWGRIYFGRVARYLRMLQQTSSRSGLSNKIYSIYFCTRRKMVLLGETLEIWMIDEEGFPGYSCKHHWFRRIKS